MSSFAEIRAHVIELLRRENRVAYRVLKRLFSLDDDYLEDLKADLIDAKRIAVDEDGRVLVWVGPTPILSSEFRVPSPPQPPTVVSPQLSVVSPQPPSSYTPPHLAERIRAATLTDGERKTITALFADLKGSTALIEGLDPEEARAIIDPALQLMMDAVHRYEGYVAQALGDGIFALFGAPIAHEDHPQRALYAALRMQEEMRRYGDQVRLKHGVPLAMRVGVNTGEVVVRSIRKDDLHTDYVPVGHSTNLAARMEQMATPGAILVTAYTHKLTEGYFAFKDLGQTQIKGVEEPLPVYEVLGAGPLRTRLQVAARRGLTRFVGRHSELAQLRTALERAKEGCGQIVGVMGEPGLGKSRLFYEFKVLSQVGGLMLEAYSVSHGKASPYLPVIELLKSYFRIEPQDDERTRREKVTGKVLTLDRSLEDSLPYLFALLGIEEQLSSLQQMDPQIRRKRTFEALKKLFLRESLNQPLILIFEDLHWIDSETQGFLDILSEGIASAKILLLVNYRPEYRHEWGQKTYYTQLRLAPFGKAEAEEFLTFLLGHDPTLTALKHQILTKTEGTPFFMEEVVQTLVEDGTLAGERGYYTLTQAVATLQLPTTVQGVLAARIDRLVPDEKALLQQLSVIGREFPLSLVTQVIAQSEDDRYRLLSALQRKEFLYEQPAFPEVEYIFKHALTQEVVYNSVLIERRKVLHEQTAQVMEQLYHDRLEEHYDELAHHYSRSGNTEKAIEYLQKAGQQAVQRSANVEAIGHITTALDLLKTMPDTPQRAQQELTLQVTLGVPLQASKGFASLEVEKTYRRALELCQQLSETSQLFTVLRGLWVFYNVHAELQTARTLGEQLLRLAQQTRDPGLLLQAHEAIAGTAQFAGAFTLSRMHCEQGLALYDPLQHRSLAFVYGHDSGIGCLTRLVLELWLLGYPDQALTKANELLTQAQHLTHVHSQAMALSQSAFHHQYRREGQLMQRQAEAMIALSEEHGLSFMLALGTIQRGWAMAEQGQLEEGITHLRHGLAAAQNTGGQLGRSYQLSLLVDALGKASQPEEGLSVVAEALAHVNGTGERFCETELYRLKGMLTLAARGWKLETGSTSPQAPMAVAQEAEGYFLKAIDIAREQHAKSWELRATVSLARLWQSQGKHHEAYSILSTIYHWFTEGFDTADLQEAKVLLAELEGGR
jgi:predicted ATPase/class 3 adenylate cyclase